jgi:hypothetical protein
MRLNLRVIGIVGGVGLAFVLVGVIIGPPRITVEGAYFSYSPRGPGYSGAFSQSHSGLFDLSDGNLWVGGGAVLVILAAFGLLLDRLRSD